MKSKSGYYYVAAKNRVSGDYFISYQRGPKYELEKIDYFHLVDRDLEYVKAWIIQRIDDRMRWLKENAKQIKEYEGRD